METFRVSRARVAGGVRTAAASRHTRVAPRARVAFALERGADGRRAVARGPSGKTEGPQVPPGPSGGTRSTVNFRAIEIDLQEAVSRFLNVPGKSGRQSVNF